MSERKPLTVPVGKTADGLYVMHEWALQTLMKRAQDAEDKSAVQAEQIAAVRALHAGHHWCMNEERSEVFTYGLGTLGPCPTARALGVSEQPA